MRIRLAQKTDLNEMCRLDADPGRWTPDDVLKHIQSPGAVKVASEGEWLVGWVAYRQKEKTLVVDRLCVPNDPLTELDVLERLLDHVERVCIGISSIDVTVPETRLNLAKHLATLGFTSALIPGYYGVTSAVALNRKVND